MFNKNLNLKKTIVLYATVLFSSFGFAQVQNFEFDIVHNSKPLGTLITSKTIEGSRTLYKSHTNIEYHLLVSIKVIYDYHVEYNDSELIEATAHIVVRDTDKAKVKTIKKGKSYAFYSNGKIEKSIESPLQHSVVQLLFEEPIGLKKIYAEEHGEFHDIKKIGSHSYLKTAPNGHKSTYYYENGRLQKSDIDSGIIKFSIVQKK